MKVKVKKTIIKDKNSVIETKKYLYNNEEYNSLSDLLRAKYTYQGDLYKEFGVSWDVAEAMGWQPGSDDFDKKNEGFAKFLAMKGKVSYEVIEEEKCLKDVIFD